MAGSITLALHTARSGLLVNQAALDTVANNIANVNSPGYSRKIVNLEQRVVSGVGAGVQLADVSRAVDEGLLKSLRIQLSAANTLEAKETYYQRLQDLFSSPAENQSLSHMLADFTTAIETLAVSPNQTLEQSELVRQAQNLTLEFQQMSETIQELRVQADGTISETLSRINALTSQISSLNDDIIRNKTVTADVSDLRDQRDQAIDELSEYIDVRYFYRGDGDVVVFTSAGRTLVDNVPFTLTHSPASSMSPSTTHAEGDIAGLYLGTTIAANDITNEISDGEIRGLIEMRDQILPDLQSQIDSLAATLRDTFNQIHNRGIPFPGLQSMSGTRKFLDTTDAANAASQTIKLDPTNSVDDVTIALFDSSGNQQALTTLNYILETDGGLSARGVGNDWTIAQVATQLQTWLQANGAASAAVSIDNEGEFNIELNSTSIYLAFRDEAATANGSTVADAEIGFDADGDGTVDETINGFANFFGLNDFFVDALASNTYESDVMADGFTASAATLRFVDGTSTLPLDPGGGGDVTIAITAGDTLTDIAVAITNNVADITASVVPDGSGFRLRLAHDDGIDFEIMSTAGTLLTTLGIHRNDTAAANSLDIRSDILNSPSRISSGAVQWDSSIGVAGEYLTSLGDDTTVQALAEQFDAAVTFKTAGGVGEMATSFSQYGASIVSRNASLANSNEEQLVIDDSLSRSLKYKSDTFRGVNLDEEMSNLILYEQAYAAAARVISVIQKMFDVLDRTVG